MLFNIFINDTGKGIECPLSEFADNTKLSVAAGLLEGRNAIQKDLDRLEDCVLVNLMKFYKAKCKVLHLSYGNSQHQYRLGVNALRMALQRTWVHWGNENGT